FAFWAALAAFGRLFLSVMANRLLRAYSLPQWARLYPHRRCFDGDQRLEKFLDRPLGQPAGAAAAGGGHRRAGPAAGGGAGAGFREPERGAGAAAPGGKPPDPAGLRGRGRPGLRPALPERRSELQPPAGGDGPDG